MKFCISWSLLILGIIWHKLKLISMMIHTLFISTDQYARKKTLCRCFRKRKKKIRVAGFDLYGPVSFKLEMMMDTRKLYTLRPVWIALTFIQDHSYLKSKHFWAQFLANSFFNLDESYNATSPDTLLKFMLNLFHMTGIQRRGFDWRIFKKNITLPLAFVWTLITHFLSNLSWCLTRPKSTCKYQFIGLRESNNVCENLVVMWL